MLSCILSIFFPHPFGKLPDVCWFLWILFRPVSQLMMDLQFINWKFKGSIEIRDVIIVNSYACYVLFEARWLGSVYISYWLYDAWLVCHYGNWFYIYLTNAKATFHFYKQLSTLLARRTSFISSTSKEIVLLDRFFVWDVVDLSFMYHLISGQPHFNWACIAVVLSPMFCFCLIFWHEFFILTRFFCVLFSFWALNRHR